MNERMIKMSAEKSIKGQCLCGAVCVTVDAPLGDISACHCEMCRKWSGSIQMGIEMPRGAVTITGPVKTFQSSEFAERGWCEACGSAVWLRDTQGGNAGYFELTPGLFENAGGAALTREVYADCCPQGYALAGDHERVSRAEYEAENLHVNEGVAK
jgi:hypothetical protein